MIMLPNPPPPAAARCCWFDDCWAHSRPGEVFSPLLGPPHFCFLPSFDSTRPVSIKLTLINVFWNHSEFFLNFTSRLKKFTSTTTMPTPHKTWLCFHCFCFEPIQPPSAGEWEYAWMLPEIIESASNWYKWQVTFLRRLCHSLRLYKKI